MSTIKVFVLLLSITLIVIGCADKDPGYIEVLPDWWEETKRDNVVVTNSREIQTYWKDKLGGSLFTAGIRSHREAYKTFYQMLRKSNLGAEEKMVILSLMPQLRVERALREKMYIRYIAAYWDHDAILIDCDQCSSADSLVVAVAGLSELYAWEDKKYTLATRLIQRVIDEKKYVISSQDYLYLNRLIVEIYYKRGVGPKDRMFIREGYKNISELTPEERGPEYHAYSVAYSKLLPRLGDPEL